MQYRPGNMTEKPFWQTKKLHEMSGQEWESLCDGCGQCCLHKLIDDDNDDLLITNVACKLLDGHTCQCRDYPNRKKYVKDCVQLTPKDVGQLSWLPKTCAYRLVHEGKDLYDWHYLKSCSSESVHKAGISVRGGTINERNVKNIADHIKYRVKMT